MHYYNNICIGHLQRNAFTVKKKSQNICLRLQIQHRRQKRQTGEKISLSAEVLCNYIMPFFNWNIQKIHQNIGLYSSTISSELTSPTHSFPSFKLPNSSDISDLICNSKPSTCNLDLHLVLFRSCLLSLVPLISVKTAAINQILKNKKNGADHTNFLSNQPFISKILVAIQLHSLLSTVITCCMIWVINID